MPIYVFRCEECQTVFERRLSFAEQAESPIILCPQCAAQRVQRVLTAPFVLNITERGLTGGSSDASCGCGSACGCS